MAEVKERVAAFAAASSSLRETAKWLAGGIFATAAGFFAGSSWTSFGSLDFEHHPVRLAAAIGGAIVGFLALGFLLERVIAVLNVGGGNLRTLAAAEFDDKHPLHGAATEIARRYRPYYAEGTSTLQQVADRFDNRLLSSSEWANAEEFSDLTVAEAGFLALRGRFDSLRRWLRICGLAALFGFGLFAWAANPAKQEPKAAPPPEMIRMDVAVGVGNPPQACCCRHHRCQRPDGRPRRGS